MPISVSANLWMVVIVGISVSVTVFGSVVGYARDDNCGPLDSVRIKNQLTESGNDFRARIVIGIDLVKITQRGFGGAARCFRR